MTEAETREHRRKRMSKWVFKGWAGMATRKAEQINQRRKIENREVKE